MLTSVFRNSHFPILVIALTAATWSGCQAVGSFQTRPAYPSVVRDDDPPLQPAITWSDLSASALVSCGKGRVPDPQTHGCGGPADVRSIAP
jgi:hypothetical protein